MVGDVCVPVCACVCVFVHSKYDNAAKEHTQSTNRFAQTSIKIIRTTENSQLGKEDQ